MVAFRTAQLAAGILAAGACLPSQVAWQRAEVLLGRYGHAMAHDAARNVTVLFGGVHAHSSSRSILGDTWEWDGQRWTVHRPLTAPPARAFHSIAHDPRRGRVVLFGGWDATGLMSDMWEWDGRTWTSIRQPALTPKLESFSMAFHPQRQRLLVVGCNPQSTQTETWEWDGRTWTQRTPTTRPPRLLGAALAVDTRRGRAVLIGGRSPTAGHWEWDGTNWARLTPNSPPPQREGATAAYDVQRGHVVMFGGSDGSGTDLRRTWTWDGTTWRSSQPAVSPPLYFARAAMAYDSTRQQMTLVGYQQRSASGTWIWNGSQWRESKASSSIPPVGHIAIAYDEANQNAVLFGGRGNGFEFGQTWTLDATGWTRQTSTPAPSRRQLAAMAYDSHRRRCVLFGGLGHRDTWEWDGSSWHPISTSSSPSISFGAMVYDTVRRRTVLYGAVNQETWEWDGTRWQKMQESFGPYSGHMAFDRKRGATISVSYSQLDSFTWEWRGAGWRPLAAPTPRVQPAGMTYDVARDRIVMVSSAPDRCWEWDGQRWTERRTNPLPAAGSPDRPLVYDSARRLVLQVAGGASRPTAAVYEYGPVNPASSTSIGPGCPGSAGTPRLTALSPPWIDSAHDLELTRIPNRAAVATLLGGSAQSWGPLRLPIDLAALGMPNCSLRVRPDLIVPGMPSTGRNVLTLTLANRPELVGRHYYAQAAVASPGSNPLGAVLSNGLDGLVGSR